MKTITRRAFLGIALSSAALYLAGCSSTSEPRGQSAPSDQGNESNSKEDAGVSNTNRDGESMKLALVVYFSCTGITERIARFASEALDSPLYRIEPQEPYTSEDLAYYTGGRADEEQNDPSARPAIAGALPDMSAYETIVLGYPIWHGQAPRIISTFLESCDLAGKTILPFCTSHSSGMGSSASNLHSLCPDANWLEGVRFGADASKQDVDVWLENSGILTATVAATIPAAFSIANRSVNLNDGLTMPTNGLGTYSLKGSTCVESVKSALVDGVRLIDTAYMYGNEAEVGQAIRESGVPREEIFVITKLYPSQFSDAESAIDEALSKMDIGYIDMMLLHHPGDGDVSAYQAMERAQAQGRIRSLGLSCYYVDELKRFIPQVSIAPALVQNEIHPYYQDTDVIDFIHGQDIAVQAWYPLGGRGHNGELLSDPTLAEIAQAHGVSIPQVILRWDLQRGVIVIPGSSNPAHIAEDANIYHFELSDAEMARIAKLNRNEKHDWY